MYSGLKRLIVGPPIASTEEQHQRLGRPTALTVFASDAISSTAYATEEILLVLVPVVGMTALNTLVPISIVVAVLLAIVITSYRQTIYAYPSGGGSYVVSRENLGAMPSLVAGASLLVDYILTVAVSISAGVAAVTSAFEGLRPYRIELCLGALLLMTLANLRGTKESGKLFAPARLHLRGEPGLPHRVRPVRGVRPRARRHARERRVAERDRPQHRSGRQPPLHRAHGAAAPAGVLVGRGRARPASRPSPTACPRSRSPSRTTRPPPSWPWASSSASPSWGSRSWPTTSSRR